MRGTATVRILALLLLSLPFSARTVAETYEPAAVCKSCHRMIHDEWAASAHARSFTGNTFRESLTLHIDDAGGGGALCISCHAPTATVPEAAMRAKRTVREGVTCDFCHTAVSTRGGGEYPRFANIPGTKRGAVDDARSPHHDAAFSALHLESRFCSGCHQFRNRHGVDVLSTYGEWEKTEHRNSGTHCQNCHLPKPYRNVQLIRKKLGVDWPADHSFRGGHDPQGLREAFSLMGYLFATSMRAYVEVELKNEKAGHMLPTGIPSHRIVLVARLFDGEGKELGIRELSFERVLGDEKGKRLTEPGAFYFQAKSVLKDDRIAPGEKRSIATVFPLTEAPETLSAKVVLSYESPSATPAGGVSRIPFYSITIPYHRWDVPWEWLTAFILLLIAGMAAYMLHRTTKKQP